MTLRALNPFHKKSVPVRRDVADPFSILHHDMDSMLEDFWGGFDLEPFWGGHAASFIPNVDVTENDKEIRISAELPGLNDKDIDVTLNHDSITIRGEKKEEKEDKGKDYCCMERSYGSFCRTIPLHVEIESGKAAASYKKGVLTVKIPKSLKAIEENKKISVKVE
jgi:HSP20 family protein